MPPQRDPAIPRRPILELVLSAQMKQRERFSIDLELICRDRTAAFPVKG
jgi:hypothetical protein